MGQSDDAVCPINLPEPGERVSHLRAVLHVPLVFIYQQHVRSPWQPGSPEPEEEEEPGACVAGQPQSELHLRVREEKIREEMRGGLFIPEGELFCPAAKNQSKRTT